MSGKVENNLCRVSIMEIMPPLHDGDGGSIPSPCTKEGNMHYGVVTPQFWSYHYYYDIDPPEYGADYVEVEAPNKRRAKVEAVRKMRQEGMEWVSDQASDGASPFTGLKVLDLQCPHDSCFCGLPECDLPKECEPCTKEWEEKYAKELAEQDKILV